MKSHLFTLSLAVSLALAGAAHAQSLPKPAEFYFDADANTARPIVAVRETGDAAVERLLKAIKRNPRALEERAQLAHLAMEGGRAELGRELYDAALAQLDRTNALWRPTRWNYGWDLYRSGDHAAALAQWEPLVSQYGARQSTATWMPPTLALVLWQLDRRDEAVQWYAAAVRTEPAQWRTPDRFATLLPDWRDAERATLAEVQQAWAANPPSWP
jgi:tetratricopeptide (TPR) repeat protein